MMSVRIAIDTGGTFTDLVLSDTNTDRLVFHKVPSTPEDPSTALVQGIMEIIKIAGVQNEDVQLLIHGTTVATNTILQRKGARAALITTAGFRDVLQIQRQDRPQLYNMRARRTPALISRAHRYEIKERMLFDGTVDSKIDVDQLHDLISEVKKQGIESIAVGFLHSHIDPSHEQVVGEWIRARCPEIRVCLSHELSREEGEYERFSTCAMNAYVQPVMSRYLNRISLALSNAAFNDLPLYVMRSNGGIMSASEAAVQCVHTILSGPAGGVVAGLKMGLHAGKPHIITADMGGTSFDVAMIHDHTIAFARDAEIDGLALKAPMLDIHTVGAGGGSIAWIDSGGALRVGPQSAGADPGPVCYGQGGTAPTVTDANLILGRLAPDTILDGAMVLDPDAARDAISSKIANPLNLSLEAAAEGIIRVVNASMTAAIRKLTVERGFDPRKFTLAPFGGAGPLHAAELAQDMDIHHIIVPIAPGVTSAVGLLSSNMRSDRIRTYVRLLNQTQAKDIDDLLYELQSQAERDLSAASLASYTCRRYAGLRYFGQGYDLPVEISEGEVDMVALETGFNAEHQRQYGFARDDQQVQLVNLWVSVESEMTGQLMSPSDPVNTEPSPAYTRPVYFSGSWHDTPIFRRDHLTAGHTVCGPAIVEQLDSTTLIWPDQTAEVNTWGQLEIEKEK
ncbi:MAG: hydantoinase/oxoprolinase family protein [Gemmatimonadota bacterium]|nr:hydantoinase/oxoprolinase family protein [Gemmatimonadota bacterium]